MHVPAASVTFLDFKVPSHPSFPREACEILERHGVIIVPPYKRPG
jgi:hypothetical protein